MEGNKENIEIKRGKEDSRVGEIETSYRAEKALQREI